jgi:hypothetical protein
MPTPHVRGVAVLNAIRFVREVYGPDRHDAVVATLPLDRQATFLGQVREASWEPLADFVAYMDAAQQLLAPGEPAFFVELGRFAGRLERLASNFGVMVADPMTAIRMGPTVWRSFHDTGRLEVEVLGPREAVATLFDFPASRAMCGRRCGAWETLVSTPELQDEVSEPRCRLDGHPACETRVVWRPVRP